MLRGEGQAVLRVLLHHGMNRRMLAGGGDAQPQPCPCVKLQAWQGGHHERRGFVRVAWKQTSYRCRCVTLARISLGNPR